MTTEKLIYRSLALPGKHFNSDSVTYRVVRVLGDMSMFPGGKGVMRCECIVVHGRTSLEREIMAMDEAIGVEIPQIGRSVLLGMHMAVPGHHYNSGGQVLRVEYIECSSPTLIAGRPGAKCHVVPVARGPLSQDDLALLDLAHLETLESIRRGKTNQADR